MNEKEPKSKDGFWAEVTLLQPWATFVMRTKLPPLIFKKMIKKRQMKRERKKYLTGFGVQKKREQY